MKNEELIAKYCQIRDALLERNDFFKKCKQEKDAVKDKNIISTIIRGISEMGLMLIWKYPTSLFSPNISIEAEGMHLVIRIPRTINKESEENIEIVKDMIKRLLKMLVSSGDIDYSELSKNNASLVEKYKGAENKQILIGKLTEIDTQRFIEKQFGYYKIKGLLKPEHYLKAIEVWDMRQSGMTWGQIKNKLDAKSLDDVRNKYKQAVRYITVGLPGWPAFPKEEDFAEGGKLPEISLPW